MTDHIKASPPERYAEISRHLVRQAQDELDKGDILQASDKVWGATAHAIKALCQRMGWNHHAHNHISAAANYVASGLNRDDLRTSFVYIEALHGNYYEHQRGAAEVRTGLDRAASFIDALSTMQLSEPPVSSEHLSVLERQDQERLLRTLTRKNQYSHGPQFSVDEAAELPPVGLSTAVDED